MLHPEGKSAMVVDIGARLQNIYAIAGIACTALRSLIVTFTLVLEGLSLYSASAVSRVSRAVDVRK